MRRFLLLTIMLSAISFSVNAQKRQKSDRNERIEAFKIAFFTEELELTSEEARLFWPIYNEMHAELGAAKKELKAQPKLEFMTDAEAEVFIERRFAAEEQRIALQRKYVARFKEILPIKKVAYLPQVERKFRQEIMRRAREKGARERPPHGG